LVIEEKKKMRQLTLFTATLALVLGASFAAQAATLTVTADQESYAVSDIITLTIIGDSEGASALGILGFLSDANGNASYTGSSQNTLASVSGYVPWVAGALATNNAFNQLGGVAVSTVSGLLTAVMTFHADSSGVVDFAWLEDGTSNHLNFFGLTTGAGTTSVTIIPEPTTAGLMGLGLVGLVIAGRRRTS
jgi:hypothetical protein